MGKMENANAVKYIRKMYLASGKSRLIYSFVNILFIGSAVAFVLLFDRYVSKRREGISNRCFLSLPHFHRCCYSHGRILALLVRLLKR